MGNLVIPKVAIRDVGEDFSNPEGSDEVRG